MPTGMEMETHRAIAQIAKSLSAIAAELYEIRMLLESRKGR